MYFESIATPSVEDAPQEMHKLPPPIVQTQSSF
jgi:hypothetical protein